MAGHGAAQPMRAEAAGAAQGHASTVPGDKSISHRALILGALARRRDADQGCSKGEDVLAPAGPCRPSAPTVERTGPGAGGSNGAARRLPGARRRDRLRQRRHRRAADHGRGGGVRHHRDLHRRRLPARPADGAGHRAAGADRRRGARPRGGRLPLTLTGAANPVPVHLHAAGALGPGEVGGAAGRPERAGRDRGDRAGGDPRPYRADARGLRRAGPRPRRPREGRRHHAARPAGAAGRRRSPCRAIRPRRPSRWWRR